MRAGRFQGGTVDRPVTSWLERRLEDPGEDRSALPPNRRCLLDVGAGVSGRLLLAETPLLGGRIDHIGVIRRAPDPLQQPIDKPVVAFGQLGRLGIDDLPDGGVGVGCPGDLQKRRFAGCLRRRRCPLRIADKGRACPRSRAQFLRPGGAGLGRALLDLRQGHDR